MGKILSKRSATKFADINIQQQAEKIISKDKPAMHPLYPTERRVLDEINRQHPELHAKITERRHDLESNVNKLRIVTKTFSTSHDNDSKRDAEKVSSTTIRHLPRDRSAAIETSYGFYESSSNYEPPPGKLFFRDCMSILKTANDENFGDESNSTTTATTTKPSTSKMATDFGIDETQLKSMITYFVPFAQSARYEFPSPADMATVATQERIGDIKNRAALMPDLKARLKQLGQHNARQRDRLLERYKEEKEKKMIEGKSGS